MESGKSGLWIGKMTLAHPFVYAKRVRTAFFITMAPVFLAYLAR